MIKGRSPYPFETICLAVSFSPGLASLIEETRRLCDIHKANAVFIHAGKKTSEKQRELASHLSAHGFHDSNSRIYWEPGESVGSILTICKREVVDLLVVGASEKDRLKLPVGHTAFSLAVRAKCSVLIYSGKPNDTFRNLVINGTEHRKTEQTILTAHYFAELENAEQLTIVDDDDLDYPESDFSSTANAGSVTLKGAMEDTKVRINHASLMSEGCKSVTEYAFRNNADLLVTYSSDHHLLIFDRMATGNAIESLIRQTPCSMLVVHSRIRE